MNRLPRPKIHENVNARQKAHQDRKRAERRAAIALGRLIATGTVVDENAIAQLMEQLPVEDAAALKRLTSSQNTVIESQKVAA